MAFTSLNQLLGSLEHQDNWKQQQYFRHLLGCWADVVGKAVSAQTHPLYIQRQVLHVATSTSAWAQNLAFERRRILDKLNAHLPHPLIDIRFSTARWRSSRDPDPNASESYILWQNHPSQITNGLPTSWQDSPPATDPQTAFQHWASIVQQRSRHLPPCPICHSPTPIGELQRWSVCALCAAKTMKR